MTAFPPGTLAPEVVTTVTLDGHYDTVTVRADGTDTIWFTTDGEDPEMNDPHLSRAAQGQTTVAVDSVDDPTVVKLISPAATGYQIWAGPDLSNLGFFGATPVAKPTGVAVTPEAIHAALVSLGLIAGP